MGQDLRELLRNDRGLPMNHLSERHEDVFLSKLEEKLPSGINHNIYKINRKWLGIASGLLILVSVSLSFLFTQENSRETDFMPAFSDVQNAKIILPKETSSLAAISPEYEKAEQYFLKNIKVGLSKITIDSKNQEYFRVYLQYAKETRNFL